MLKLPSEMTISQVDALHTELQSQVHNDDNVCLDMSDVIKADSACIQLLCALQKSLQLVDYSIVWEGSSDALTQACKTLGVAEYLGLNGN
ncbi:STAS domain-containing protein [Pseudoalteromonas sp. SSDWG2]|uniref:STAS domain-containing protein n=1 Tax=Pseudoalteromonas sp. SSDWG2 TaxID=3139391 RepID=UPI003BAB8690